MSKAKTVQKVKDSTTLITKVLLFLYMVVGLSPKVVEIEYEGFQWFYFTVLNAIGLCYLYYAKDKLDVFLLPKRVKQFFLVFILLILVSIISLYNAINISEGIVHLLRFINVFASIYLLFSLIKQQPKEYFEFVCKVCVVLLAYHSFVTLSYFLGNFDKPRTGKLYVNFLHYYGNINIFTASLIVKLPFAIYIFLKHKHKAWGFFSGLIIICTALSLFYCGSRTALLSLSIILLLVLVHSIYSYLKEKNKKKSNLFTIVYFTVAPLLVLFIFSNSNKLYKNELNSFINIKFSGDRYLKYQDFLMKNPKITENSVKIAKEKDDFSTKLLKISGRYRIWKSAFNIYKQHPVLGVGYGNFKVYSKPWYFKTRKAGNGSYGIPIRVHNDFYEKFVETGIFGGILYILLFVIIGLELFKSFKDSKNNITALFVLLLSAIAYSIDAFLNFPTERVPVQLFFVLIASFIFAFGYKEKLNTKKLNFNIIHLLLTVFILVSVVLNYMVFKVYSFNTILKNEKTFKKRGYDLSYTGLERQLYSFPQLDQDAIKISYYKANKAIKEGKYTIAMNIINQSLDESGSAQNHLLYRLKAETFLREKKHIDSAEFYYRKGFEEFPGFKNNYLNLNNIYTAKKEISKKEALMHSYTKQNYVDTKEWMKKADYFNKKNGNLNLGLRILDTALAYNGYNHYGLLKAKQKLLKYKKTGTYYKTKKTTGKYNDVINLYNKRKFVEARTLLEKLLKENPNDFYAVQYIGIVEMNLKNYKKAVKYLSESIHSKIFKDGRAEYCRAYSYEKLGQIKKAKADYRKSRKLGYPLALKLAKEKYE